MTWFSRQERGVRILLILLAVLVPAVAGVLITERLPVRVTTNVECAPIPTPRLGKCPPDDDRPVLARAVPTGRGEPFWRVMSWDERDGWDGLTGNGAYRVSTWVELPQLEDE